MLIQQKGNICILNFTKSNNNCYNATGQVKCQLGWRNKKCDQHMSGTGNTELKGLETEKTWDHL